MAAGWLLAFGFLRVIKHINISNIDMNMDDGMSLRAVFIFAGRQ